MDNWTFIIANWLATYSRNEMPLNEGRFLIRRLRKKKTARTIITSKATIPIDKATMMIGKPSSASVGPA